MPEVRSPSLVSGVKGVGLVIFQVAALAIKQLNGLDLTSVEKIKLGKAYGIAQWLKDGYTALVADARSPSLEELESLGLRTALRIVWAQNQTHLLSNRDTDLFCGWCRRNVNGLKRLQYRESEASASAYQCDYCGRFASSDNKAYALTYIDHPPPRPSGNPTAAEKVAELFKDEIEEAERRSTGLETDR